MDEEAGGFVLLTQVPTAGDLAQSARDVLPVSQEPHGTEQHDGLRNDPVLVKSLDRKKPERIAVLGLVCWLALLIGRWMARPRRTAVDTTSMPWPGWDKQATERPTSFMMVTTCAGVPVVQLGHQRQLARPLSAVQQPSLTALDVPPSYCTGPQSGEGNGEASSTPLTAAEASPALAGRRSPADARPKHEQPRGAGPCSPAGQGPGPPEPPHLGSAGLDRPWSLVWRESRIPDAHPGGSAMGLPVCMKL
jgi:hypothetical protein